MLVSVSSWHLQPTQPRWCTSVYVGVTPKAWHATSASHSITSIHISKAQMDFSVEVCGCVEMCVCVGGVEGEYVGLHPGYDMQPVSAILYPYQQGTNGFQCGGMWVYVGGCVYVGVTLRAWHATCVSHSITSIHINKAQMDFSVDVCGWMHVCGGVGALVFQAGYHPRKRTLKTYPKHIFSGVKIYPKYAFLHAFFLISLSWPFQNLSVWPKTHPFSNFAHFCTPKQCTCIHCLVLKDNPNYVNFFTRMISNFKYKCPPPLRCDNLVQVLSLQLLRLWKGIFIWKNIT